jgi:glycosyl transferase family 61
LLIDEDASLAIAQRCGFEVIYPETLSMADQVRLFSEAGAVVGQGGAAFTNLAFAPDGIRVLMITKEEVAYPTYVDLSTVLDQHYRWLLGWTEGSFGNWLPMATPYRISLELLERELGWAASEARGLTSDRHRWRG